MLPSRTAPRAIVSILLLCLTVPRPISAHNGAIAVAEPVGQITIDGDLSDWPAGMATYTASRPEAHSPPTGPEDYSGAFRLGYSKSENALYIAVEVQDESAVTDTSHAQIWNASDGCELYIDVVHSRSDTAVIQYAEWGDVQRRDLNRQRPDQRDLGFEHCKVGVTRRETGHTYDSSSGALV